MRRDDSYSNGVLIVDPNPDSRAELARGLEHQGWEVWEADDGEAAMDVCRRESESICAALVDLQLPGLQGARILADLGQFAPFLARCAVSSRMTPYLAAAFRRVSDTPLFTLPSDPCELSESLREIVSVPR
jgi:CheY-like chemotaxis protein